MVICALSKSAVRALGAGQVLPDPVAVVKELIDNALDAHATSISIQIASNTLDFVQVRDNGHGIAPVDRPMMARRYCTSKIIHEDDLRIIGGSTLGFRGEALASAAEVSESLVITTRIEGEEAAAVMSFGPQGELEKTEPSSLPVGTTVRIIGFLDTHPVRKQVILKSPEGYIKAIKSLLQSYAFARTNVRLAFHTTHARKISNNFVFAPSVANDAKDTVAKLLSAACAKHLAWVDASQNRFVIRALFIQTSAEPGKVSGFGSHISVDHRPVCSAKGFGKRISKAYREALKKVDTMLGNIKDPFLYFEISCPAGSYDVNIEPRKDDVLFEDPNLVYDIVERVLDAFYNTEQHQTAEDVDRASVRSRERNLPRMNQPDDVEEGQLPAQGQQSSFTANMFGVDEDHSSFGDAQCNSLSTAQDTEEVREADMDVHLSNPWVIAKLNASQKPRNQDGAEMSSPPIRADTFLPSNVPFSSQCSTLADEGTAHSDLPTLLSSPPTAPLHTHLARPGISSILYPERHRSTGEVPAVSTYRRFAPSSYDENVQPSEHNMTSTPVLGQEALTSSASTLPTTSQPAGTPLIAIPFVNGRGSNRKLRPSGLSKPFTVPLRQRVPTEKVWFDHLENSRRAPQQSGSKRRKIQQDSSGLVMQGESDICNGPQSLPDPDSGRTAGRSAKISNPGTVDSTQGSSAFEDLSSTPDNIDLGNSRILSDQGSTPIMNAPSLEHRVGALDTQQATGKSQYLGSKQRNLKDGIETGCRRRLETNGEAPSQRCSSIKSNRTVSSALAFEIVPFEERMQNVVHVMRTSAAEIARLTSELEVESLLTPSSDSAIDGQSCFTATDLDVNGLAVKLHTLLLSFGSQPQDTDVSLLIPTLQAVFQAHRAQKGRHEDDDMLDS